MLRGEVGRGWVLQLEAALDATNFKSSLVITVKSIFLIFSSHSFSSGVSGIHYKSSLLSICKFAKV